MTNTLSTERFSPTEFGFDESFLQVTFSGHRGFHLHYRDPSLFHLDSEARRSWFPTFVEGVDVHGGLTRFSDPNAKGWTKRIRNQIPTLIEKLVTIAEEMNSSRHEGITSRPQGKSTTRGKPGKGPASIQKLADMFLHEERRQSVERVNRLGSHQGLFLDLSSPMHQSCLARRRN